MNKLKLTGTACRVVLDGFRANATPRSKHNSLQVTLSPSYDLEANLSLLVAFQAQTYSIQNSRVTVAVVVAVAVTVAPNRSLGLLAADQNDRRPRIAQPLFQAYGGL